MTHMRRFGVLLPLIAILAAGCFRPVTIRGVRRPFVIHRIVSLSPSTTEIVGMYGVGLAGRTGACNFPVSVQKLPVYGGVKPDYEKLAKDRPDLIILDADLYSGADQQKLRALKFSTFTMKARTINEFTDELKQFGAITGSELTTSGYIDTIHAARATAQATSMTPKPTVLALSGATNSIAAGTKSFIADEIRASGGEAVGPEADRFVPINPEVLLQTNPDVILLAIESKENQKLIDDPEYKAFVSNPRYQALKAVKSRSVYPINGDILLRRGARVDQFITALFKALAHR